MVHCYKRQGNLEGEQSLKCINNNLTFRAFYRVKYMGTSFLTCDCVHSPYKNHFLKGLSREIDFKNVDEKWQILALIRAVAGF
jgi:hypothetical protein